MVSSEPSRTPVAAEPVTAELRRISWGAVLAGVAVALVAQLLIILLGAGVGLGTINPASGGSPDGGGFGIGAAIWWALSGIVAAFAGGWVAARLAGMPNRVVSLLHGLVTWAATVLVIFYLLTTAIGAVVGGAFNVVGGALSGLGGAAGAAASGMAEVVSGPLQDITQEARVALAQDDPAAAGEALATTLSRVFIAGEEGAPEARQAAVNLLVERGGMTEADAQTRIDQWQATYNEAVAQAEQQMRQAAEATANAAATASIYSFIALVLGAIAGALGGRAGMPGSTPFLAGVGTRFR